MLNIHNNSQKSCVEPFRPQFHFTPVKGWMNDPNGLVYYDGEYHLFYQHIPDRTDHDGFLHWGHAKSFDLFNWSHLPVALYPDDNGDIWSGSIVVDYLNTSQFATGKEKVMVAIFTQGNNGIQEQGLAFSNDRGNTWTKYPDNPVIPNPGLKDFRDPKIFWHEKSNHWVLIVAAGQRVRIYTSLNLKVWNFTSEFGNREGCHSGIWECPDLFELVVDDEPDNNKWVMLVSILEGAPNGGSGTQYFIGDFDGKKFKNNYSREKVLWLDYGKDNYAGVTFSDISVKERRQIFIGWMSNWQYAQNIPTQTWRGMMTVPRELRLKTTIHNEIRLVSFPVEERNDLKKKKISFDKQLISSSVDFPVIETNCSVPLELFLEFEIKTTSELGLFIKNEIGESVRIGYNVAEGILFIDRRNSGYINFNNNFALYKHTAPLLLRDDRIELIIFIDMSSIEIFANGGFVVLTDLVFPKKIYDEFKIYSLAGEVQLNNCTVWELNSVH